MPVTAPADPAPDPTGQARIANPGGEAVLLQAAVDEAARLLVADGGMIYLLDGSGRELRFAFDAGITDRRRRAWVRRLRLPLGVGMFGRAVAERRVVSTADYMTDTSFAHTPDADRVVRVVGMRSMVVAPLIAGDSILGALGVFHGRPEAVGEPEIALVRALADHAAAAIANLRLVAALAGSREAATRRAETERTLREIAARITAVRDPTEILHLIAAEAARILGHERVSINLLNDPTGASGWTWYSPTEVGRDAWPAEERILVGEGVVGKAIAERRPFITGDYLTDDRFIHRAGPDRYKAESGMHSTMAAPMFAGDQPLGAMLVEAPERDAFDEEDGLTLDALARQAAIALSNARLFDELVRSREEVELRADSERTLRQIAARITAIRDPAELLQGILGEAARLLWASRAQIDLIDAIGGVAQWVHPPGTAASRAVGGRPDRGMSGWAVTSGRAVWTGDYRADRSFRHTRSADAFVRAAGLRSIIAAPLVGDEGLLGVIQVGSDRPGAYGPLDAELLEGLASQAAIAITNARLIAELARSREEVARRAEAERTLREIAAEVTALRDPREVVALVIGAAATLLGGDVAEIGLADDADPLYAFVGATSLPVAADAPPPRVVAGLGVSGLAYQGHHVVRTGDYTRDERFVHGAGVDDFLETHGLRSAISAPLLLEGRAFGAMTVISGRPDAFGEADGALLQALADQAAIAVANARLITELERSQTELARRVETERALRDIAARITALADTEAVLDRIVEEARRLLGSDGAHLTLIVDDGPYLEPVVIAGASDDETRAWLKTQQFPLVGGMNGLAASLGEAVWTEDYLVDPRIPHEPDDHEVADRMGIRGMAVAPLRAPGGEVIGTLATSYARPRSIASDELALLQGLADHAAIAVANSRLLERVTGSEARYRFMVEQAPDIVFSVDPEGRFTYLSESLERLLGWPTAEVVGQHFRVLVAEGSLALAAERWAVLAVDPELEVRTRLALRHRDGSVVPFEAVVTGIRRDGVFAGIHGSARDISERERLERDRERLERDLRRQAAEIAASEERSHLARELHDSVTQALFSATLVTRTLELLLARDPARALEQVAVLRDLQRDALAEMRSLIFELRPGSLQQDGLVHALRTHCAAVEGRVGLPIVIEAEERSERLPIAVEDGLYRIAQEALHNIVKHAAAHHVRIELARDDDSVRLSVDDDGKGFDPAAVPPGHLGLAGMRARAERLAGRMSVTSAGSGTRIEVVVPIDTPGTDPAPPRPGEDPPTAGPTLSAE